MKTSFCKCGNRLFFNNHSCLACGRLVGDCQVCSHLTSFSEIEAPQESPSTKEDNGGCLDSRWQCDQPACLKEVVPCRNRLQGVCTSFIEDDGTELCPWCQFTVSIPDLSQPKNKVRWAALEAAKRRLLFALQQLDLPPYLESSGEIFPLKFMFQAPVMIDGVVHPVITGHADGVITINAEEADSDHREATRIALGEPQRTLIGHMRHEIGHYIDWAYASRVALDDYCQTFGDPGVVDYELAKQRHYDAGAPPDWPQRHVSAYASMHPWEDFAETVNAYLDILAIAETARDQKLAEIDISPSASAERIVKEVLPLAVAISEFNLDLGLQPLLPEHLSETAIQKLAFVHALRSAQLKQKYLELLSASTSDVELAKP